MKDEGREHTEGKEEEDMEERVWRRLLKDKGTRGREGWKSDDSWKEHGEAGWRGREKNWIKVTLDTFMGLIQFASFRKRRSVCKCIIHYMINSFGVTRLKHDL